MRKSETSQADHNGGPAFVKIQPASQKELKFQVQIVLFPAYVSATHPLIAAVGQFGAEYKFHHVAVLAPGGRFWGRPKVKVAELDFHRSWIG